MLACQKRRCVDADMQFEKTYLDDGLAPDPDPDPDPDPVPELESDPELEPDPELDPEPVLAFCVTPHPGSLGLELWSMVSGPGSG